MSVPSYPRVMPLAKAAREILGIDPHEGYRLAREGQIPGVFKIGKCVFVSTLIMIRGLQTGAAAETAPSSPSPREAEHDNLDDDIWDRL